MEKSYKNILQEYCQKNNLETPEYNSKQIGKSENNTIFWQSILSVNGLTTDAIDTTKKAAEQKAAAIMYTCLQEYYNQTISNNQIMRKQKVNKIDELNLKVNNRIILVDGENCDFEIHKIDKRDMVLIFVAKNTTKNIVFEYQEKYENCYVFISESVGKDAADHLLTFYAGILSVINRYGNYYVLTKDHYGEFLEKFMKNCKFICSLDEI